MKAPGKRQKKKRKTKKESTCVCVGASPATRVGLFM